MFPRREQIVEAVYSYIERYRTVELKQIYAHIERIFNMTPAEIAMKDPDGASLIEHEVRWALQTLKYDGKVVRGDRVGVWKLA